MSTYYCTTKEVRDALPTLTIDAIDDASIRQGMKWAVAVINSYIAKRYSIPFDEVPSLINMIAVELAVSFVSDPTHSGDGTAQQAPFSKRKYDAAIAQLKDIASGNIDLTDADGAVISSIKIGIYMSNFQTDGTLPPLADFDLYNENDTETLTEYDLLSG